jgi:hypothetical protein
MIPTAAPRDAAQILDREYLAIRGRILELAADLDRLDRAPEPPGHRHPDERLAHVRRALEALLVPGPDRAETIQGIFSLPYDPEWARPQPRGAADPPPSSRS